MYFVTLTRKMGTNGSEIARRVADELQYALYDTAAIENAAREMGFLKDVQSVDEKVPSIFERLFSHRPEAYLDRLSAVIYELASRGNAVFLGRGSHILLKTFPCALHVRVTASPERRIQNLAARGYDKGAAVAAMNQSDHERGAFIKFAFGVDWDNSELYDVVFNMDNVTTELAADTILHMARSEEIRARSTDAMKSLEMMALARRAGAALIEAGFLPPRVSVSVVEQGRAQLTGLVAERRIVTEAEKVLNGVKGITSVDNQIRVVPGSVAYT
jgi:cytidylate kinase